MILVYGEGACPSRVRQAALVVQSGTQGEGDALDRILVSPALDGVAVSVHGAIFCGAGIFIMDRGGAIMNTGRRELFSGLALRGGWAPVRFAAS